jgi:hypothetical protein
MTKLAVRLPSRKDGRKLRALAQSRRACSGFVKITSTLPIISLSLNAEVYPVFSSLPPGDLPSSTPLVTP